MKKIIALLLTVMCVSFVSCGGCNQTSDTLETTGAKTEETKIFYNEDGSISREEFYYANGVLKQETDYHATSKNEYYYAENGNATKEITYYKGYYTVFEFNSAGYWGKVTQYDSNDNVIKYYEIEYNKYGALKSYRVYNGDRNLIHDAKFAADTMTEPYKFSVSLNPNEGVSIMDPAVDFVQNGKSILYYIDCEYENGKIVKEERYEKGQYLSLVATYEYYESGYKMTALEYDANGNLTEKTELTYDANGNLITSDETQHP